MIEKKNLILSKIDELIDEKPISHSDFIFWIERIIIFIDNEFPDTLNYQKRKGLIGQFESKDKCLIFGLVDTENNIKKILKDLKTSLQLDSFDNFYIDLHHEVKNVSLKLFKDGHYSEAIFEAVKALNNYVKKKASITDADLFNAMAKAFSEKNPILFLNELKNQSEKDEQDGFRFLFQGAMKGIRNPKGHETIKLKDTNEALEYLAFISLLFRKVDHAKLKKEKKIEILNKDGKFRKSYNRLLASFLDKGTINRAAILSDDNFNINEFDYKNGIIKVEVVGIKESSYNIEINTKNKTLVHNCHDFQERRAADKKFCKHLAKLFLILKDIDSVSALKFLREIAENINEYKFLSFKNLN